MSTSNKTIFKITVTISLAFGLLASCTQPPQTALPTLQSTQTTIPVPPVTPPRETSTAAPIATHTVIPPTSTFTPAYPTATLVTPSPIINNLVIDPQNVIDLQPVTQINQSGAQSFAWVPGGMSMALVTDKEIVLYKGFPSTESGRLDAPGTTTIASSPDGQLLASTGEDNIVHIWDLTNNQEIAALKGHTGAVTGLAFSPDGKILATSSFDNSVRQWEPKTGKLLTTWNYSYWPATVQFSPDGSSLAGVELENFTVHIWNSSNGKEQRALSWTETASPALYSAIFSPDWKTLAWTARGTVQLMDVKTEKLGQVLSHEDFVSATSWSPDGKLIATASAATVNGTFSPAVILWDVATGKPANTLVQPDPAVSLGFSTNGFSLATLVNEGLLSLWAVIK
jgi:WD40 repeat protein